MKTLVLVAVTCLVACAAPAPTPTIATTSTSPQSSTPCAAEATRYCVANPDVTQATIGTTICRRGWTATIRPPVSYTEPLKLQQMRDEGLSGPASNYEEDHRLPLELGGAPRDPYNLSPEAHPSSFTKDSDENAFKNEVCSGKLSLLAAQQGFVAKWLGPYPAYRAT